MSSITVLIIRTVSRSVCKDLRVQNGYHIYSHRLTCTVSSVGKVHARQLRMELVHDVIPGSVALYLNVLDQPLQFL